MNNPPSALRRRTLTGIGLTLISPSACSNLPPSNLQAPEIKFQSIELREFGRDTVLLGIAILAENRNAVNIPLSDLQFELKLAQIDMGKGKTRDQTIILLAGKSQIILVDFSAATTQIVALMRASMARGSSSLAFEIKGTVRWGDFPIALPFQRHGTVDLLRAMRGS